MRQKKPTRNSVSKGTDFNKSPKKPSRADKRNEKPFKGKGKEGFGEKKEFQAKEKPFKEKSQDFGNFSTKNRYTSKSDKNSPNFAEKKPASQKRTGSFRKKENEESEFDRKAGYQKKSAPFQKRAKTDTSFVKKADFGKKRGSFQKRNEEEAPVGKKTDYPTQSTGYNKTKKDENGPKKRLNKRSFSKEHSTFDKNPSYKTKDFDYSKKADKSNFYEREENTKAQKTYPKKGIKRFTEKKYEEKISNTKVTKIANDGLIRLNKYLSNAGICSRREADDLIKSGVVSVNGKIITELGFKVSKTDQINYGGTNIKKEKNVYVLLNKPKDYITTMDDPEGRKTVMELVKNACRERIYPVGRLDRNTTGLLLFTNDGEMAMKLTHPKHRIQKLYSVELNKALTKTDLEKIKSGIELEDGLIQVDALEYTSPTSKKEVGVEIHSGKNRIVRRIFESLGYEVLRLDRVMFAGLTKKDLPRGRWRILNEKEIHFLRMI